MKLKNKMFNKYEYLTDKELHDIFCLLLDTNGKDLSDLKDEEREKLYQEQITIPINLFKKENFID